MTSKTIDKGRSMLNAADDGANPNGLILSEKEREHIYGELTRLDNVTDALLKGKTGWKQQVEAALSAAGEVVGIGVAVIALHYFVDVPSLPVLIVAVAFVMLQKVNLLLTHEKIDDTHARRLRDSEKERKEWAKCFKDAGCEDMSLEE